VLGLPEPYSPIGHRLKPAALSLTPQGFTEQLYSGRPAHGFHHVTTLQAGGSTKISFSYPPGLALDFGLKCNLRHMSEELKNKEIGLRLA
jgi:hypothetical protein